MWLHWDLSRLAINTIGLTPHVQMWVRRSNCDDLALIERLWENMLGMMVGEIRVDGWAGVGGIYSTFGNNGRNLREISKHRSSSLEPGIALSVQWSISRSLLVYETESQWRRTELGAQGKIFSCFLVGNLLFRGPPWDPDTTLPCIVLPFMFHFRSKIMFLSRLDCQMPWLLNMMLLMMMELILDQSHKMNHV